MVYMGLVCDVICLWGRACLPVGMEMIHIHLDLGPSLVRQSLSSKVSVLPVRSASVPHEQISPTSVLISRFELQVTD